jgi:glycosyltransferase involved in cell wall biosynthesis
VDVGLSRRVRLPVTVIIPTLNEAANIAECVASAAPADEVLVADAGSTDGTVAIARAAGATVLERTGPTIAAQRNAAIAAARHRWIFALDADERITPALAAELATVLAAPAHAAYRVRCQNFYLGVEQTRGGWGRDWHVRLFGHDRRYIERRVHEGLEPVADTGELAATILHHPYRSLSHHLEKLTRYAEWGAADLWDRGRRARWSDLSLRPAWRFINAYLFGRDVLDGRRGFVQSVLTAYAGFLKYAHLWAREQGKD